MDSNIRAFLRYVRFLISDVDVGSAASAVGPIPKLAALDLVLAMAEEHWFTMLRGIHASRRAHSAKERRIDGMLKKL